MGTSPYTRERLEEAAQASRTLTEALERLGVDPRSPRRNYLRDRMKRLGIDTHHFEREAPRWTREILQAAVTASTSMNEVLRHLGVELVGGHHTHLSRRIRAYGIDTSHFQPQRRTPAIRDNRRRRAPAELLVALALDGARRVPPSRLRRALLETGVPDRCSGCGIGPEWDGEPLTLEVDHIDGDWRNNRPENLRLLCPNCHSVTDTYRGRRRAA